MEAHFGVKSCIISSFYIKPQPDKTAFLPFERCIISSFYIKPQPCGTAFRVLMCCIISSFYIKPQHTRHAVLSHVVVLYLHSTSNHNFRFFFLAAEIVVLYLHSTSNHNPACLLWQVGLLYYIFILHQTTTMS